MAYDVVVGGFDAVEEEKGEEKDEGMVETLTRAVLACLTAIVL